MRIYNTMTRKLEDLVPQSEGKIKFFVCGPTVYDDIHIGNARTFVIFDSIVKYLRYSGYMVFYVQNITDIDDRIIDKANKEDVPADVIGRRYLGRFMENMRELRVDSVSIWAPSSAFVHEITGQIQKLMGSGHAYIADDGIYFRISTFDDYGKLSGQKIDKLKKGARVETDPSKEAFQDFVLWKFRKPGEPFWPSPWGDGRPGWHIEDTAITEYFFGPTYDIHGAGSDLVFPHHEAEIAQMRSISGEDILSGYWVHSGMLNMVEEKMAKSTGNIVRVHDILEEFSAEDLRFFFLNSGYRSMLEFSRERIVESASTRSRIQNLYDRLPSIDSSKGTMNFDARKKMKELTEYLEDDFDTRSFFRELLEFVSEVFRNISGLSSKGAGEIRKMLDSVDSIFGIISHRKGDLSVGNLLDSLLEFRDRLRNEKKYSESDELRRILSESGINLEDGTSGTEWRL